MAWSDYLSDFQQKDSFGLDIGYETLKVVQLKKTGANFRLIGHGIYASLRQPFDRNGVKDKKKVAEIIKNSALNARIKARLVVSALPESLVFTKIIRLPKTNPKELSTAVSLETASFIPVEPDQVYLDYQIVGEIGQNYEVLVVATPKNLVLDYINTIKLAGFKLACLETKPLANLRALINKDQKETVLILDLGAETSSLTVCDAQGIKFTTTFDVGGNVFRTKTISGIQAKEALNTIVSEIASGIKYHQGHQEGVKISKILLSGGGASLEGLIKFIQNEIGLKTEYGDPWQKINNLPPDKNRFQFTTAIGLAMREL